MKVYLDDERPTPEGWVGTRWPDETIEKLETGEVTHLSLDHDLGGWNMVNEPTGMDVLLWLEDQIGRELWKFPLPLITLHTANPAARQRMKQALCKIHDMIKEQGKTE